MECSVDVVLAVGRDDCTWTAQMTHVPWLGKLSRVVVHRAHSTALLRGGSLAATRTATARSSASGSIGGGRVVRSSRTSATRHGPAPASVGGIVAAVVRVVRAIVVVGAVHVAVASVVVGAIHGVSTATAAVHATASDWLGS